MRRDFRFWIVVAFRDRADLLERCTQSILDQNDPDYTVLLGDDDSTPTEHLESLICDLTAIDRVRLLRHDRRVGTLRNQIDLIRAYEMASDDVLVFVDGDDRLNGPCALSILREAYSDGTLLTYGSYITDPPDPRCSPAEPYPAQVLRARSFRRAGHRFNHLRTMRRRVFDQITDADLLVDGRWPMAGGDYALMMPALELAAPRIKVVSSPLYVYTSNRDDSDWRVNADEIRRVHRGIASKPRKKPLR